MTRVYDASGRSTAVTVIEAGGNVVVQTKTVEKEGYAAIQVGFDDQKPQRLTKPALGHFKKGGAAPKKVVREFRSAGDGSEFASADLAVTQFEVGDIVDVIGRSKGKGFQGVVRKHNAAGQPETHGSMMHRRTGAIGMRSTPGRIWKNASMPGHMGDKRTTVQNLRVVQVRSEDNVILVAGAIPGPTGSYVVVRPAIKGQHSK
jgi:large subunit ribosomal protein L3